MSNFGNSETMIKVDHVSMEFNMASEKLSSLKEYAIALAKGTLFFESFKALDDISFEVKKGDVFGILGTNGSGKSTLLKIIAGVLTPSSGTCEVKGSIAPLIELGAGFDMELSARENIYLNGALLGYSKDYINEHFKEIVDFAEIEQFLDIPMKNYSSGMVARVAFAIATAIVPDVLIVDEVLAVGDFMFQQKCEDRINELIYHHGVTVLMVSHSTEQIERLCNKAIWIEKGDVRFIGDAQAATDIYRLLGGRTGSDESKELIYKFYKKSTTKDYGSLGTTITGSEPTVTAIQLAKAAWEKCSSVILYPGDDSLLSFLLLPLYGSIDAPLLPYSYGYFEESVSRILSALQPENVYILGDAATLDSTKISNLFPGIAFQNIPIKLNNIPDLRKSMLTTILKKGIASYKKAYIGYKEDILSLLRYSPQILSDNILIIPVEKNETMLDSQTLDLIQKLSIEVLVPFGDLSTLKNNANLEKLSNNSPFIIDSMDFPKNDSLKDNLRSTAAFVSGHQNHWPEILCASAFAAHVGIQLLLTDPTNLDNFCSCISTLSEKEVDNLIFIGSLANNKIDCQILCNAILD